MSSYHNQRLKFLFSNKSHRYHTNVLPEIYFAYPNEKWCKRTLLENKNITLDMIKHIIKEIIPEGLSDDEALRKIEIEDLEEEYEFYTMSRFCPLTIQDVLNTQNFIPWDMNGLAANMSFTCEDIINTPEINWEIAGMSCNPNLNIDFLLDHLGEDWNWYHVTINSGIKIEDILDNPDLPWRMDIISDNPNVRPRHIDNYSDIPWDYQKLSLNPYIPWEYIKKHMDKRWNFGYVAERRDMKFDYFLQYPTIDWMLTLDNKLITKNLAIEHIKLINDCISIEKLVANHNLSYRDIIDLVKGGYISRDNHITYERYVNINIDSNLRLNKEYVDKHYKILTKSFWRDLSESGIIFDVRQDYELQLKLFKKLPFCQKQFKDELLRRSVEIKLQKYLEERRKGKERAGK